MVGFFSLDLEMTQECIGACCVEISNKGKLMGNLEVTEKPPDNYGRNFYLYKVLLFLGVISTCSNFF